MSMPCSASMYVGFGLSVALPVRWRSSDRTQVSTVLLYSIPYTETFPWVSILPGIMTSISSGGESQRVTQSKQVGITNELSPWCCIALNSKITSD